MSPDQARIGMTVTIGKAWFMGKGLQPDEYTGRVGDIVTLDGDEAEVALFSRDGQRPDVTRVWLVCRRLSPWSSVARIVEADWMPEGEALLVSGGKAVKL